MGKLILFILNIPFTLFGLIPLVLSGPYHVEFYKEEYVFVFKVRKIRGIIGNSKKVRAATVGHIILLSTKVLMNDLEHEIIHVKQCDRYPVIYPFLYLYETYKNGYRLNRFEDEAYTLSKSVYKR